MENERKKKAPAIDEDYLMSMMAGDVSPEPVLPEPSAASTPGSAIQEKTANKTKPSRAKKQTEPDYETLFCRNSDTNARNGKSVYIRPEYHERLTRIVRVVGGDKMTIYAYLDNVLEHHFSEFADQIRTSFNEKYKPIL